MMNWVLATPGEPFLTFKETEENNETAGLPRNNAGSGEGVAAGKGARHT